ncbi:MAG: HrpB1 family type III secretion system apparatus protein [Deltaproteobacteria bacterium]|jgi:hypothetical protein|nr:HrpB1 family type III secretion system apparatus protein [Deltaproteobacteria bacterium]
MPIGHKTSLVGVLLGLLLALGCSPKPVWHSLLPPEIGVGEFSGPGGEALTTELKRRESPKPLSGRTLILSGQTQFTHQTTKSQETVLTVTKKTGDQTSTQTIPLIVADAKFGASWSLVPVGSNQAQKTGQTEEVWRRSYGGYLAQEGVADATPEEPEKVRDNLLAKSLAALIVAELGPDHTPYNLAKAYDQQSVEAAQLVSQGHWDEAAKIWREILEDNPNYAPALYNLALYHERSGQLGEAWKYYRLAYRSYDDLARREALTRTTDIMFRLGRPPWLWDHYFYSY